MRSRNDRARASLGAHVAVSRRRRGGSRDVVRVGWRSVCSSVGSGAGIRWLRAQHGRRRENLSGFQRSRGLRAARAHEGFYPGLLLARPFAVHSLIFDLVLPSRSPPSRAEPAFVLNDLADRGRHGLARHRRARAGDLDDGSRASSIRVNSLGVPTLNGLVQPRLAPARSCRGPGRFRRCRSFSSGCPRRSRDGLVPGAPGRSNVGIARGRRAGASAVRTVEDPMIAVSTTPPAGGDRPRQRLA